MAAWPSTCLVAALVAVGPVTAARAAPASGPPQLDLRILLIGASTLGTASQPLTVIVQQAPSVTSAPAATALAGQPFSFTFTAAQTFALTVTGAGADHARAAGVCGRRDRGRR